MHRHQFVRAEEAAWNRLVGHEDGGVVPQEGAVEQPPAGAQPGQQQVRLVGVRQPRDHVEGHTDVVVGVDQVEVLVRQGQRLQVLQDRQQLLLVARPGVLPAPGVWHLHTLGSHDHLPALGVEVREMAAALGDVHLAGGLAEGNAVDAAPPLGGPSGERRGALRVAVVAGGVLPELARPLVRVHAGGVGQGHPPPVHGSQARGREERGPVRHRVCQHEERSHHERRREGLGVGVGHGLRTEAHGEGRVACVSLTCPLPHGRDPLQWPR